MTLSTIVNLHRKQASMQQRSYQAFKANTLASQTPRKGKCFHKTNLISTVISEKNPPSEKFKEMGYAVKEGCYVRFLLANSILRITNHKASF